MALGTEFTCYFCAGIGQLQFGVVLVLYMFLNLCISLCLFVCFYHSFIPLCRYPVILSIENHCSVKQQQAMAHILTSVLKDKLFSENVDQSASCLPSPQTLKGKILIKVIRKICTRCSKLKI